MTLYSVSSDQHCHGWSQFSQINADGINSRLATILSELERQARELVAAGGSSMFLGGDLFHVRGRIEPEVLNPTMDCFKRICALGVQVYAITGNHDLSGKFSQRLGNAMQALDEIEGFTAVVDPMLVEDVMLVPWIENLDDLRAECLKHARHDRDLIIHAPLNGVIKGLPDHGLDPVEVATWGYRRVFVGHYHNHKEAADGVYSIGATTHQTWSDPGTAAGFLMVDDTTVTHHETQAPQFVNIDAPSEIDTFTVSGNFVRLRLKDIEPDDLLAVKRQLEADGALGWVDHCTKKREITRGVSSTKNVTLEVSVANYVAKHADVGKLSKKRVAIDALEVLRQARTVGSE